MKILLAITLALSAPFALACSRPAAATPTSAAVPSVAELTLVGPDGARRTLREITAAAPATVVVFVAAECPCLGSHLDRLRALEAKYAAKGVQFLAVDSEVGASPERAAKTGKSLDLRFPVLVDEGAKLADAVGAEYATYSIVMTTDATVRFRGGIDSDKRKLHDDAVPYLADALDDTLAGQPVRRAQAKTLGCSLRKW
jgi:peroxiredoxin